MALYTQFWFLLNYQIFQWCLLNFGVRVNGIGYLDLWIMILIYHISVTISWQVLCSIPITWPTSAKCYNICISSLILRNNYYLVIEWHGCEIFIWIVFMESNVLLWLTLESRKSQFLCVLFIYFYFFLHKLAIDICFFFPSLSFPYRHMKSVRLVLLSIVMGWNLVL
jgi:hypothetical protein